MTKKKPPPPKKRVEEHPGNTWKRDQALTLILQGETLTGAALKLGVRRETVSRWRNDPEFVERLDERRAELRDAVHDQLLADIVPAVKVLKQIALNDKLDEKGRPVEGGMARVRAVVTMLETLGWSKNKPASPTERKIDIENEEQVIEVLRELPSSFMQRVLDERKAAQEAG